MLKIIILASEGFQDEEVFYPFYRFQEAGWDIHVAAETPGMVNGKMGLSIKATHAFQDIAAAEWDAVIVPGGLDGSEKLRINKNAIALIRGMNTQKKLIAAICHGLWLPISAGIVRGKKATCYPAITDDLKNAGADYQDSPVVVDGNFISSRRPRDLPAFCAGIILYFSQ